jgi:hypothetical protein
MVDVNVTPFEVETTTRHGTIVRADVYLPRGKAGPYPILLGASAYQKALRHLAGGGGEPPGLAARTFLDRHGSWSTALPSTLRARSASMASRARSQLPRQPTLASRRLFATSDMR